MPHLFDPLTIRDITFANRVFVSPMCQYSAENGHPNDWHFVHLGSRAVGGAGAILMESTAVAPEGRINVHDLGLWDDAHIDSFRRIVHFLHEHGTIAGVQISHAGRKASTHRPWEGLYLLPESEGGWSEVVAPSEIPFSENYPHPQALSFNGVQEVVAAFAESARRALEAGFRLLELHAAHGYLIHQFLSPLSNQRQDVYGGSFENRTRLLREIVAAVRGVWPERIPLFVRFSATDWTEGGWDIEQSVELARLLKEMGVDLIDCSSGGNVPSAKMPIGPGYQTSFAERIRREAGIMTGAVGMVTSPQQAEHVIATGQADAVLLGRELLRYPYWPLHAAHELRQTITWPVQYLRAAPNGVQARNAVDLEVLKCSFADQHAVPEK
jgi:2,4-dienoyl-CoA reductase-like NADH-dependent reductase (Old Yellow Enzyme family)